MKASVIALVISLAVSSCATIHAYQSGREYLEAEEHMLQHDYRAACENFRRALGRTAQNGPRRDLLQAKIKVCEAKVSRLREIEAKRDKALKTGRHAVAVSQYQTLLDEQLVSDHARDEVKGVIRDLKRRISRQALKRSAAKARTVDGLLKEGDDLLAEGNVLDALARYEDARDAAPKDPRPKEKIASIEEEVVGELEVRRLSAVENLTDPPTEESYDSVITKLKEILSLRYHPATKKTLNEILEQAVINFNAARKYHTAYKYLLMQIEYAPERQRPELRKQQKDLRELCNATKGKGTCA